MKLSKKGDYGLRAVLELAKNYSLGYTQIKDIAKKEKIPLKFLEQILLNLKNSGFLVSKMGVGGGYRLSRLPEEITLGEVLRALEGPLAPISCVSVKFYRQCPEENSCGIRSIMNQVRNAIANILDHTTLYDVANHNQSKVKAYNNKEAGNVS
jgi:Rrf2 family protein